MNFKENKEHVHLIIFGEGISFLNAQCYFYSIQVMKTILYPFIVTYLQCGKVSYGYGTRQSVNFYLFFYYQDRRTNILVYEES